MRLLHGSNVEIVQPNLAICQSTFSHDYDVVIGPVADAFVDKEIERHKQKFGPHYLETAALLDFAEHVSQFGSKYIQYCLCTEKAIKELIKE